jgi:hypothetical protein
LQAAVLASLPHLGSLLVKGARFMAMERLLVAIDASLQAPEAAPHAVRPRHQDLDMLLVLAQWLQGLSPEFGFFRVFQYLTFRAVMAALTALLIGLAAGPVGDPSPDRRSRSASRSAATASPAHLSKSGTPTMGGVLILSCIAVSTLLWFDLEQPLCLDRAAGHAGLWRHRLGGRLAQGGAQGPRRACARARSTSGSR